jgi:phosphoglycerate dehydrogenase-like enzyme
VDFVADAPEVLFVWEQRRSELQPLLAAHHDRLRWVHFRRVGIGADVVQLFEPYPRITLTNGSGASGVAIAEHVLTVVLALTKRLPTLLDNQRAHRWEWRFDVSELHGQTACIVGMGDLGRSIARLLRAFGVHTIGIRRAPEPVPDVDETYPTIRAAGVLERATWLILAAPLTPETAGMVAPAELGRLPRGACVVNVGRGPVLDEPALIAALQSGHLGGAALDVLTHEPLPAESPLWDLPNVIITPHASAHTSASDDRSIEIFVDKLARFRRGEPLDHQIERSSWT